MTNVNAAAESCLIATCAHLSLTSVADENFSAWVSVLADVLPDAERCAPALVPVWVVANDLVQARTATEHGRALTRLHHEVKRYYLAASGIRHEAWSKAAGRQVIE